MRFFIDDCAPRVDLGMPLEEWRVPQQQLRVFGCPAHGLFEKPQVSS
jgi:hypothetical protein